VIPNSAIEFLVKKQRFAGTGRAAFMQPAPMVRPATHPILRLAGLAASFPFETDDPAVAMRRVGFFPVAR
jgi:hypothetical protein